MILSTNKKMSTAKPCSFLFSLPCLKGGGIFEENDGGILFYGRYFSKV